jgi:gamma-glutamyltranspeptidase/glutathione hydrolase/leukotriene-C4 hydrolase
MVGSVRTGIILNNEMDDFSSPNIKNLFGVPPSTANCIAPGKRPLSSMVPSIVLDGEGKPRIAIGGAGGTHIISSVAQVLANVLWLGRSLEQALDLPRIHHQLMPMKLYVEPNLPKVSSSSFPHFYLNNNFNLT